MLLDALSFHSRSHRLQHVHRTPRLPQREVIPCIIRALPKADLTMTPNRGILALYHPKACAEQQGPVPCIMKQFTQPSILSLLLFK